MSEYAMAVGYPRVHTTFLSRAETNTSSRCTRGIQQVCSILWHMVIYAVSRDGRAESIAYRTSRSVLGVFVDSDQVLLQGSISTA